MQVRVKQVEAAFRSGYRVGLRWGGRGMAIAAELRSCEPELQGFAFEGAAMALALLDGFALWRPSRITNFLHGPAEPHTYMVHVGVGWAWARLRLTVRRTRPQLEPLLCWLAFDGCGFHEGFFHWPKYLGGGSPPRWLTGYARRAFDQGLGRSAWFVHLGDPRLIHEAITVFPPDRHADLWSGIGLAATYAGIVDEATLIAVRQRAGQFWPHLTQGAAFAAKARQRAGNLTEYTDFACRTLCDLPAGEAARLCDSTLENLPDNGPEPAYEIWRQRIQRSFAAARNPKSQTTVTS